MKKPLPGLTTLMPFLICPFMALELSPFIRKTSLLYRDMKGYDGSFRRKRESLEEKERSKRALATAFPG